MKYYLEITMLNQQIFNTKAFPDFQVPSRENAESQAEFIFDLNCYRIEDIVLPVSQIAYITIKPLTSNP